MPKEPHTLIGCEFFSPLLQLVIFNEATDTVEVIRTFPSGYIFVPANSSFKWEEREEKNRRVVTYTLKPIFKNSKKAWLLTKTFASKKGNLVEHNEILSFAKGEKLFKEHFGK